jgi:DtxR family Mn-dependent transcriptional regulator
VIEHAGFAALALAALVASGWALRAPLRRYRRARNRRRLEDALKHLFSLFLRRQPASAESLAGALNLSAGTVLNLINRMESNGLVHSAGTGIELTPEGERSARHMVRAHRLLETYLADEAGMPLGKVHQTAERAEHELTEEGLDALDARLGYPLHDPHGDPIPSHDGTLEHMDCVSLTDLESSDTVYVVHVEDEPDVVFAQILASGIQPGDSVRVLDRAPDHLLIAHKGLQHRLAPVVAANIHVRQTPWKAGKPAGTLTLAELPDSAEAQVVSIDPHLRGFARRRLLDLGLTPGAEVRVALQNAFGDPRAYRVRGTLIALRREQAGMVWVRSLDKTPGGRTVKEAVQ